MTSGGVLVRILACFALVFATWNPTDVSFFAWIDSPAPLPLKAVAGAVLLLLHILFARVTWLSLGLPGTVFVVTLLLLGVFTLNELGAIDLSRSRAWGYVFVSVSAMTLMIGLTWSLMKRRVTGQSNYLNPPP
jgi:hypothetical protein